MTATDASTPAHLLFATDLSARCDRARERAIELARRWGARLTVVHAIDALDAPNDQPPRPTTDGAADRALRLLREDFADVQGVSLDFTVAEGRSDRLILDIAARQGCDLIVTGIAGNDPLGQTIRGSTVTALARHAPVPMLVVKKRPRGEYRHILVSSDFSAVSAVALDVASRLFDPGKITLFNAYDLPFVATTGARERHEAESEARAFLARHGGSDAVRVAVVPGRDAAVALADHVVKEDVDLVMVGTHGAGGLMTVLLGGTTIGILDEAPCDIMVVPARKG